ncbi:malonyl-CoA decarboxylase family protein [Novosphingobium sp. YJ-S2-02]|uniref:Malonyl-CoA decarboxylase family protein n=1 Tax=Novosphingobium aureum TaxID=2792964 RepID=A0A931H9G7_9SPHN|nr:malonyl-CoA decarboxylase family protein [Novosphingobium aureum]MBH0111707.1 malonyl-CoA decarboxylase family protein [Novosphingobium aureum]
MATTRTGSSATSGTATASATGSQRRGALDLLMKSSLGKLLRRIGGSAPKTSGDGLLELADALLSVRGRASGPALAAGFFDHYEGCSKAARKEFLGAIHGLHPADSGAIDAAIERWNAHRDEAAARALHAASEAPSRALINQLNLAPQGTRKLIAMREDLLDAAGGKPKGGLAALDRELESAFTSWFNAGFLELRRIGWDSPAVLLERIIRYEAVHTIQGWDDLRRRVEPADRRCYGFFHPQMPEDPLIFVEVALTETLPGAIHQVIAETRKEVPAREANCAIFYSISNCQKGLKGIPFGNHLIKRVVSLLKEDLPQLKTFATLSPVPGFAKWLAAEQEGKAVLPGASELRTLAARYLLTAKGRGLQPRDPVARFHLGNGARLEAIHANADLSPNGLRQSHGIMVNYLYDLDYIEANSFALNESGTIAAAKSLRALIEEKPADKGQKGTGRFSGKAAGSESVALA